MRPGIVSENLATGARIVERPAEPHLQQGTLALLGWLCFLVFAPNVVLLIWLMVRESPHGLIHCTRCGRAIACPHCAEEDAAAGRARDDRPALHPS